jgi:hypothetical protein
VPAAVPPPELCVEFDVVLLETTDTDEETPPPPEIDATVSIKLIAGGFLRYSQLVIPTEPSMQNVV